MDKDAMYDKLIYLGVSERTLKIAISANGYSTETLEHELYEHTGFKSFDQLGE